MCRAPQSRPGQILSLYVANHKAESDQRQARFSLGKAFKMPASQVTEQRTTSSVGYEALNGIRANSYFEVDEFVGVA